MLASQRQTFVIGLKMSKKEFAEVIYESNQGIATITLNRPAKINSLTYQMHADLRSALDLVEQDPAIRVVLITGAGRGFCAGQDLADPATSLDDLSDTLEKNYNVLVRRMANLKQPIIAAVNGVAAGAGANLAIGADLTLMGKKAVMTQAFVRIGLLPDAGGTWFLPRRVGLQKALGLAMTGETITGEEAERMGLIWKAVDDESLMTEAEKLAQHLASLPALALAQMKQAIRAAFTNTLDQQLDVERDAQVRLGKTKDFKEGIEAFLQKRPAKFIGE